MIRIVAIQCRNVGAIADLKLEFAEGLNLILGKNEAGKSTLIRTLAATLFGAENDSLRPVGFTGDYGAAVRIATPQGDFILDRNFADNRLQVFTVEQGKAGKIFDAKVSPRGRSSDVVAWTERLQAILGVSDRELFEASVLLHQQELAAGKAETVRKIKQILAGQATHDTDAVIDGLWNRYYEITCENPDGRNKTKPRELEIAKKKRDQLVEKQNGALEDFNRCLQLKGEIHRMDEELLLLETKTKETDRLVKVAADYFKYEDNRNELIEKHREFSEERNRILDLKAKIEVLDRQIAELGVAGRIDDETAANMSARVTLDRQIGQQLERVNQARERHEAVKAESRTAIRFTTVSAIMAVIAAVGSFPFPRLIPLSIAFLVVSGLLSIFVYYLSANRKKHLAEQAGFLETVETELARLKTEADAVVILDSIRTFGSDKYPALLADREKAVSLLREKDRYEAQLEVLPTRQDAEEALSRIAREMAVLAEQQASLRRTHPELETMEHEQVFGAMTRLSELEDRIEALQENRRETKERYAALAAVTENPEPLAEQIEDLAELIARLEERRDAFLLAVRSVQEGVEEYRGEYLQDFSQEVDRIFSRLINDGSRRVLMDSALNPSLQTEKGSLPIDSLSAGTRDQLYFAARLSLAEKLTNDRKLPLLLDDPLVNFDSGRKSNTIDALVFIAAEHQVLLFSHDEGLGRLVDGRGSVIRLS